MGKGKRKGTTRRKKRRPVGLVAAALLALAVVVAWVWWASREYVVQGNAVTLEAAEFRFSPANLRVTSGEITFTVVNRGRIPHALAIQGPGVQEESAQVGAGDRAVLSVNLRQPGQYKLVCPIRGHAQRGMVGNLRVVAVAGGFPRENLDRGTRNLA